MRLFISLVFCFQILVSFSQTVISGQVIDRKSQSIVGANLFIEGTYDGTVTDEEGNFSFSTYEEGEVSLRISYLGYETKTLKAEVNQLQNLVIKLRESATSLDAVEVSASTFKAGEQSKLAVLNALDIVTTAGSNGDVIAALQTLPGTQSSPDDGRLFVRGGNADETTIYVDGLKVFTPYTRTVGGTPARGRFSPFLFKGVNFSTGAYSAEYGQALSGVLNMKSTDEAKNTATNISLMTVGLGLGHTQKWKESSISASASYINLAPYNEFVPNRLDFVKPFSGLSGEVIYRKKTKKGIFKTYLAGDQGGFRLKDYNLDCDCLELISISNANVYANSSYTHFIDDRHSLFTGFSWGQNRDQFELNDSLEIINGLKGFQARTALKSVIRDHFILNTGVEWLHEDFAFEQNRIDGNPIISSEFSESIVAVFVESDYFFTNSTAIKLGLRAEHSTALNKQFFSPRVTLAQKLNNKSQISAAYGNYYQKPNVNFRYFDNGLNYEKADHYVINFNYKTKKNILRLEGYYKDYDQLIRHEGSQFNPQNTNNMGEGFAYGIDVFWRANQSIKNLDYWVSYSWIKTEREYLNFPESAIPSFATAHNFSVVTKLWMPKLKSQLGTSYNFISGRPYENPNTKGFQNEFSRPFHSINLSWAYLISQQKILFASVSNPINLKNEFGYRYASNADVTGVFPGEKIRPNADQFFFVGFFITISPDKKENQLNNL